MAMTIREAFEKGTDTFNAHDIDGFASVLADDVVYRAPGGISGQGKAACAEFFAGWIAAFPDAHVEVHAVHLAGDVVVEEGTFTGRYHLILPGPVRHPAHRPPGRRRLCPRAPLPRRPAHLLQPAVRPAPDARTARPHPGPGLRELSAREGERDRERRRRQTGGCPQPRRPGSPSPRWPSWALTAPGSPRWWPRPCSGCRRCSPCARTQTLPGCSHLMPLQQPAALARLITAFTDSIPAASAADAVSP